MIGDSTSKRRGLCCYVFVFLGLLCSCQFTSRNTEKAPPGRGVLVESGKEVVTLKQNWSDGEAAWFYNAPQGSMIMPLECYVALEQAGSTNLFNDPAHIRELGYIPRSPDQYGNPEGLPIGFVRDARYPDKSPALGMTCAACHTAQIEYEGKALLIDGAPAMGDLPTFLLDLEAALAETLSNESKFERFAGRMRPPAIETAQKEMLRSSLGGILRERREYNDRNFQGEQRGRSHARVDALGVILNEVSVRFMGCTNNGRRADAPVSYPCLWDTPHHDRVQWNAAVENVKFPLTVPFKTREVGALGRNAGEVLGVFGTVDVVTVQGVAKGYASSVNRESLIRMEKSVEKLWSPQWPTHFPSPNPGLISSGRQVFAQNCVQCHNDAFDRTDARRKIVAITNDVGTDAMAAYNFNNRTMEVGPLKDRRTGLITNSERFTELMAAGSTVLQHVVTRVLLYDAEHGDKEDREEPALPQIWGQPHSKSKVFLTATTTARPPAIYKARPLNGIWATAPYLHNGSVPTLADLLKSPTQRPKKFYVGNRTFDPVSVGFVYTNGPTEVDTSIPGNGNEGHVAGTSLGETEKRALLEYLKTL